METKFKLKQSVTRLADLKEYLDAEPGTCALPDICQIRSISADRKDDCLVQYEITRNVGSDSEKELIALEDAPRYIALYVDAKAALQTWRTRHAVATLNLKRTTAIDHYMSYAIS